MAKVMISLPDPLLARVDAAASERGITRSALMRELASARFEEGARELARQMRELSGHAAGRGGDAAEQVKAGRP